MVLNSSYSCTKKVRRDTKGRGFAPAHTDQKSITGTVISSQASIYPGKKACRGFAPACIPQIHRGNRHSPQKSIYMGKKRRAGATPLHMYHKSIMERGNSLQTSIYMGKKACRGYAPAYVPQIHHGKGHFTSDIHLHGKKGMQGLRPCIYTTNPSFKGSFHL